MGGAGGALGAGHGAILALIVGGEKQELPWHQELAEPGGGLASLTLTTSTRIFSECSLRD